MKTIQIEKQGEHHLIRLNRPKANAINHPMVLDLQDAFWQLQTDPDCKGVLLTGREQFFSAGLDVMELYDYSPDELSSFWRSFSALIRQMAGFSKPLVCAINGHSPAGGCLLAICCDERIMTRDEVYRIGLNEIQVGIVVPQSIFDLYSFWLGRGMAYSCIMEARLLTPENALKAGLVHQIAEHDKVESLALERLNRLTSYPQDVWSACKMAGRKGLLEHLNRDFDTDFGPALQQWWTPSSRAIMQGLIARLKK